MSRNLRLNRIALSRPSAIVLLIIALIGVLYLTLLVAYVGPPNSFWSTDQGFKLIQIKSLLWNRYASQAVIYPGAAFDPQYQFSPFHGPYIQHEGQLYPMWSAAFAFISSVPFFFFGYPGLYIVPLLSTLLLLWVCAQIGRRLFDAVWVVLLVIVCGVASPFFFYSLVFWEHTLAALLVLLALWAMISGLEQEQMRGQMQRLLGAGALIGLAAWLRPETILSAPALGGALLLLRPAAWRSVLWLAAGTVAGLLPMLLFNLLVYGSVISPHILVLGPGNYQPPPTLGAFLQERLDWAHALLAPTDRVLLLAGLVLLAGAGLISRVFRRTPVLVASYLLALCVIGAMAIGIATGLSEEYQTTLLISFPFVLLCLLPPVRHPTDTDSQEEWAAFFARLLCWSGWLYVLLALLLKLPTGGAQWGPRMLLPAIPMLACGGLYQASTWFRYAPVRPFGVVLVVTAVGRRWRSRLRFRIEPALASVLIILLVTAVLCEAYGLRRLQYVVVRNHTVITTAAQSQQQVIITDTWYATALIAPLFYEQHSIYLVDDGAELDALLAHLAAQGVSSFYYMGSRLDELRAGSQQWPHLTAAGEPQPLPHQLVGATYRLVP